MQGASQQQHARVVGICGGVERRRGGARTARAEETAGGARWRRWMRQMSRRDTAGAGSRREDPEISAAAGPWGVGRRRHLLAGPRARDTLQASIIPTRQLHKVCCTPSCPAYLGYGRRVLCLHAEWKRPSSSSSAVALHHSGGQRSVASRRPHPAQRLLSRAICSQGGFVAPRTPSTLR